MDPRRSETPFRPSIDAIIIEEQTVPIDTELEACVGIMSKHHGLRTPQEIELFVNKIARSEIFGRSLLENLDSRTVIKKLMPFMKQETFSAGKPIFHYEQPGDKMYILLRGKAKEFVPKGIDEIEEESHYKYGGFQYLQGVPISMPELSKSETPSSMTSLLGQQKPQPGSLNTISEENEEDIGASELTKKRLRKLKAVLPFLKKLNTNKNSTQYVEEYRYKRTIKKIRSILKPSVIDEEINVEALERELGCYVADEFKKYPRQYFIGGILKVRFSKYLFPGAQCGLRALRDNSLRSRAVFAEEDCFCVSLSREDFTAVLENEKALNIDKIEFFKSMFNMIDEKTAIEFALLWENHPCKMNEVIFQQSEPSNYLYVLCTGEIMLSKTIPQAKKAKPFFTVDLPYRIKKKADPNEHTMRVATICSGDFFGEEDFFDEKPREFTATVNSTKAKVYKLQYEKYKNLCKNYSEIMKEIRRMMSLKTGWKKERLEGLYQHHSHLQEKNEVKEVRKEQEKNLIALGLLSPELQPSSLRLKSKLLEKTKIANTNTNNDLKMSKSPIDTSKSQNERVLDTIKEIYKKDLPDEDELFSRTRIPRQYEQQKHSGVSKQDLEPFKLEFTESTKRPGTRNTDSRGNNSGLSRPATQSRDRGLLSSPSLKMVKKRFLKHKKVVVGAATLAAIDTRECKDSLPSLDLDMKVQSQDVFHNTSLTHFPIAPPAKEKNCRQTMMGPFIVSPKHANSVTSLDRLDRFEKGDKHDKGSLATTDASSRQALSKTVVESRSLNKVGDELIIGKIVPCVSPMHAKLKARASLKSLKTIMEKRPVEKSERSIECNKEDGETTLENHKAFRLLSQKAKALGLQYKRSTPSLTGVKCVSVSNIYRESHICKGIGEVNRDQNIRCK